MKKWLTALAILAAIGLVAAPVALDRAQARWALARVAVLADQGDPSAEAELALVAESVPDHQQLKDYWLAKLKIALKQRPASEAIEVARQAAANVPIEASNLPFTIPAIIASEHFYGLSDYVHALDAMLCVNEFRPFTIRELKYVAYLRSLAIHDLDGALEEIDLVLKAEPDAADLLDTRAWILFQMGRLPEALEVANKAVEGAARDYRVYEDNWQTQVSRWMGGRTRTNSPDGVLTELEAEPPLWYLGVIRYHRAKILEALGRTDEAELDMKWLEEHRLPRDERMR